MTDETKVWLEFAEKDLDVAKHLYESFYPRPLEIICFHCQQSAEKAVKALIIHLGAQGGLPKLHDVSFLILQIKNMVEIPEEYYEYADVLTPYGVAIRYPSEQPVEDRHAAQAIRYADAIYEWAKNIIV